MLRAFVNVVGWPYSIILRNLREEQDGSITITRRCRGKFNSRRKLAKIKRTSCQCQKQPRPRPSSLHLDITFGVFHSRRVVPKLHRRILRADALPAAAIMQRHQRTCSALLRRCILARLALALDLPRQRDDVAHTDLCEQGEVLVAGTAQGKP